MDKARWDKLAAAGGIIGVVLFIVAGILYGSPPGVDEDTQSVADFFADNRSQVLTSIFLQGLGVLAILWFVAALVTAMRDVGESRLATAAFGSFLLAFSIGGVAAISRATLAYSVADEGSDLVLPLYHMSVVFDVFVNILGAGLFLAVGGATLRTGLFARWWGWLSVVAGLILIVGGTAWARDGFWSPTGGAAWITFIVFLVWMVVTSALLTMRMRESVATSPSTAAPAT
jgi:Domain of unknown function (DUF4386)